MSELKLPYDEKIQNEIKSFFNNVSSKKKSKFIYKRLENGNLEIYDAKTEELISSIQLYYYRPITKEEFIEMDNERKKAIIDIEEEIDIQKNLLRKAYQEYKINLTKESSEVIKINEELHDLELKKVYLRSPIRVAKNVESIDTRFVDFEQSHEVRKLHDVQFNIYRDFPLWKLYGRYTDSKEILEESQQKGVTLLEGEVFLKNGKVARIFNDTTNENNFLSIFNLVEFVYNNTKFTSAYQAFEATRLNELGYEDLRNDVLKNRSSRLIRMVGKKIPKALKNTKEIWKDILKILYEQNTFLIKDLLNTNDSELVFANNIPYLGGIGITIGTEEVLDPKLWKTLRVGDVIITPNIVGNTLMELRSEFKEKPVEEIMKGGSTHFDKIKEKSIDSNANANANAKKGAIINYYKKH
jgi:predicted NAD-dependent protein-ADP-ribosyltransferase YbiA (DUF1768 family)